MNEAMDNITEQITGKDVIDVFDAEEAGYDDYDPKDNYVALEGEIECPNCGSKDTKMYQEGNGPDDYNTWIECMECGFQGGD